MKREWRNQWGGRKNAAVFGFSLMTKTIHTTPYTIIYYYIRTSHTPYNLPVQSLAAWLFYPAISPSFFCGFRGHRTSSWPWRGEQKNLLTCCYYGIVRMVRISMITGVVVPRSSMGCYVIILYIMFLKNLVPRSSMGLLTYNIVIAKTPNIHVYINARDEAKNKKHVVYYLLPLRDGIWRTNQIAFAFCFVFCGLLHPALFSFNISITII